MAKSKIDDNGDMSNIPIRILIVDDDDAHAQAVGDSLERIGCDSTVANSGEKGVSLIERENYDVIITDMMMDGVDGLGILGKAKEELPEAEVIVVTGHGTINSAVTAMQNGAYTYLPKPLDINELRAAVQKASTRVRLIRRNAELRRNLDEKFGFEGVIGTSPAMKKVVDLIRSVAPTDSTVLIEGESGTGKELVARALHQNSLRKTKPFVPLNISALPDSILESELFGHEAGAFTGANVKRIGKFEYANGGSLFLDEVGEMPTDTQVKLLRVLEERKITRIGANEEIDINVRLIAATNADLKTLVDEKKFRDDLFYRLGVIRIFLPPLRERRSDIPLLMDHFLKMFSDQMGKSVEGVSRGARQSLMMFDWPGNIRQLKNTIEHMFVVDNDGLLDVDDLPMGIAPAEGFEGDSTPVRSVSGSDSLIGHSLNQVEKYYIERALELTEGKREEAASMLGIGERTLYRKIKEYGLNN